MTTAQWGTLLLYFIAPSATLVPLVYMVAAPWYRSLTGWALMTDTVGLALLVDLSVLYRWLGPAYRFHDEAVLFAFAVIGVGSYLYLVSLLRAQLRVQIVRVLRRFTRR